MLSTTMLMIVAHLHNVEHSHADDGWRNGDEENEAATDEEE